jgi:hypothetical protein
VRVGPGCPSLGATGYAWIVRNTEAFPPKLEYTIPLILAKMSNLQSILDAVDKYAEQTGINLKENPFVDKVKDCDSPSAVLLLLQDNVKEFKDYRDNNRKFIECISPVVQFVHAFSGILGEAAGLVSHDQS